MTRWVLLAVVLVLSSSPAAAQPTTADLGVQLARACWSESGPMRLWECGAIWHALTARAARRRVPVAAHLDAYTRGLGSRRGSGRPQARPWLYYLDATDVEPQGWPSRLPWTRWAPRWRRLRKHATWMTTEPDPGRWSPCRETPLDWGVGRAVVRYLAANPRGSVVDCGPTRNVFLRAT